MLPIHLQNQTASSSAHKEPTGTQSSLKEEEVIEEDESPIRPRVRCDEKFHTQVKRMTESNTFNFFIIFIIFVNALIMALETEESLSDWHFTLKVLDDIFLGIYTVEFILKIYAEPKKYWFSVYNLFDFAVLAISYVQLVMLTFASSESAEGFKSVKVLRALRTLRTLRTVSFIKGLQVLVIALIDTIRRWVINIILLLILLMFLFANMGYYFFGDKDTGDVEHWGSLGSAMLTLFSFVTVDGWTDIQEKLDEVNMLTGRIFTITFIFLGHFIFSNVFIGVVIMNISEATENYKQDQKSEREAIIQHKKEYMMMRQQKDVKQMLERQKRGNFSNFYDMVHGFEKTLRHDDSMMCSEIQNNIIWMEIFINTLDHMDATTYRLQQFHFEMANLLAEHLEDRLKARMQMQVLQSQEAHATKLTEEQAASKSKTRLEQIVSSVQKKSSTGLSVDPDGEKKSSTRLNQIFSKK